MFNFSIYIFKNNEDVLQNFIQKLFWILVNCEDLNNLEIFQLLVPSNTKKKFRLNLFLSNLFHLFSLFKYNVAI